MTIETILVLLPAIVLPFCCIVFKSEVWLIKWNKTYVVLCAEQNLPGERETLLFLLGRSGGLHLHAKLYAEPFFLKQQLVLCSLGWYRWLIYCEREILFVGWKGTAYKPSEHGVDEASSFIIDATICQHVRCPTTI